MTFRDLKQTEKVLRTSFPGTITKDFVSGSENDEKSQIDNTNCTHKSLQITEKEKSKQVKNCNIFGMALLKALTVVI